MEPLGFSVKARLEAADYFEKNKEKVPEAVGGSVARPPNHPLIDPKYPLLRAIRTPLKGPWGVLVATESFSALEFRN